MNPYTILAKYYDKLNGDCDYNKWSQYLYNLINCHFNDCKGLKGADGACGSGKITIALKKAGFSVYGFDISEEMLAAAAVNSTQQGVKIEFLKGNLKNFKSPAKLDFITTANDGINYIEENSLLKCFKNIYANLKNNGLFLFDISSRYKLKNIIGNNTFSDDNCEVTYIWNNSLQNGDTQVAMDMIFFVRQGVNYLRFDENHIQYIYEEEYILQLLKEAGFKTAEAYDFLSLELPKNNSQRIQFKAVK